MRSRVRAAATAPPTSDPAIHDVLTSIRWELREQRRTLNSLLQAAAAPTLAEVDQFVAERRLGFFETLDKISSERLSFARYGDGEMRLMLRRDYNLGFQKNSLALGEALMGLFTEQKYREKVLIGFPHVYRGSYWSGVWADLWPEFKMLASQVPQFGLTHVSRPLFFEAARPGALHAWRKLWDGCTACIITGKGSRFELVPALFDNLKQVRYIYSLPKDAFDDLPRVRERVDRAPAADIYLISLGPAGTILAADLGAVGKWALDIGHISDSYRVAYESAKYPERLPLVR